MKRRKALLLKSLLLLVLFLVVSPITIFAAGQSYVFKGFNFDAPTDWYEIDRNATAITFANQNNTLRMMFAVTTMPTDTDLAQAVEDEIQAFEANPDYKISSREDIRHIQPEVRAVHYSLQQDSDQGTVAIEAIFYFIKDQAVMLSVFDEAQNEDQIKTLSQELFEYYGFIFDDTTGLDIDLETIDILASDEDETLDQVLTSNTPSEFITYFEDNIGKVIEFDGVLEGIRPLGEYQTRYDMYFAANNPNEPDGEGPFFVILNQNPLALKFEGNSRPDYLENGAVLHLVVEVVDVDAETANVEINPLLLSVVE